MTNEQRMVAEFHRTFHSAVGTTPAVPEAATWALQVRLIQEEFGELQEALAQGEILAVAKELADLLYVVYGMAVVCGLDIEPIFQEVHRSNLTKVGGHKRADGKWMKPSTYSPAELAPLIAVQGARPSSPTSPSLSAPQGEGKMGH